MRTYKIIVEKKLIKKLSKFIIEISALAGFNSISMKFPVINFNDNFLSDEENKIFVIEKNNSYIEKNGENYYIYVNTSEIEKQEKKLILELALELQKNRKIVKEVKENSKIENIKKESDLKFYDQRNKKGLESIFENGFLNKDNTGDMLPDSLDCKIIVNENKTIEEIIALSNFAARFTMDLVGYEYPISLLKDDFKNNLLLTELLGEEDSKSELILEEDNNRKIIKIKGNTKDIEKFSEKICEDFIHLEHSKTWHELTCELKDKISFNNFDNERKEYKVYEKEYDIEWEVEKYRKIIEKRVLPNIKNGDKIKIISALSENLNVREQLKKDIIKKFETHNAVIDKIDIFCAYKQGYSWIEETLCEELKKHKKENIGEIKIFFKEFLSGEKWEEENGALPSFNSKKEENPEKWLDIPLRYLQELYPIDDTLEEKIGISRNHIKFYKYTGDEDITYEIQVCDKLDNIIYRDTYLAYSSERPYLDEYPKLGIVHPGTGYLRIFLNDYLFLEEIIKTDLENVWDIYQKEILPTTKKHIQNKYKEKLNEKLQPFFKELKLEIGLSEPNYKLNSRQDLFSTLDSFHEDIYFLGIDFFKSFGNEIIGNVFDSPGLIHPVIYEKQGQPFFKATLVEYEENDQEKKIDINLYIKSVTFNENNWEIEYIVEDNNNNLKTEILEKKLLLIEKNKVFSELSHNSIFNFQFKEKTIRHLGTKIDNFEKISIDEIDLYENRVIGYEDYISIIEKLKNVEGLIIKKSGYSHQNRDIYSIEFKTGYKGYISKNKLINENPVYLINSRHHANEVSATNTAFLVVKELLKNNKYREISKKINIVIIPFENTDGGAFHYELQKNNPEWIFHGARFNSLGREFMGEYFNENTIHSEAKVFTKLWSQWLPDVITDNHGVPSHEWAQQFSGYTAPNFKGFWLPRALMYGYFWWVKDDGFEENMKLAKSMEKVIADSLNVHENIVKMNEEWKERFKKYANSWLPKLFPAEYFENLIMYWLSYNYDKNHKYASVRYPWITSVYFTSEVADETAQGDYLGLCSKTNYYHTIATIDLLSNSKKNYESYVEYKNEKIILFNKRIRPLIIK